MLTEIKVPNFIPQDQYNLILNKMPILCIDILIRNYEGKILLLKRKNDPEKGKWWFPGGRLFKNESIEDCIKRKVKEEIGCEIFDYKYLDLTQTKFDDGLFRIQTHTVNLTYLVNLRNYNIEINGDHSDYGWFSKNEIDNLHPEVNRIINELND